MDDDFDIERYRIENPMDYLKAIDILNNCSDLDKDEAFKYLYRITRLHIPNTLYKYYSLGDDDSLNNLKLSTLEEGKVFLAKSGNFNDPFENKAFYYRNKELNRFEELRRFDGHIADEIMFSSCAASFTKVGYNSMPMWAHYSNNHSGFCVAYNMKEPRNVQLVGCTMPIQYIDKRIDITDILVKHIDLVLKEKKRQTMEGKKAIIINELILVYTTIFLQNIKHSEWAYEKEFRCSAGKTSIGMPYITAIPSAIYIGYKCSHKYTLFLHRISKKLKIPAYMMQFSELNDFQLSVKLL